MKTAIIYATKTGTTKKVAEVLAEKIKGEVKLLPIANVKPGCLLRYDFVIIAGSIHYGRIQSEIKSFVNKNRATFRGILYGLYIMCMFEEEADKYMKSSFGEDIVENAMITACFGGEVNPNEGNFVTKKLIKANLKKFEEEGKEPPAIRWERVDEFADEINKRINK